MAMGMISGHGHELMPQENFTLTLTSPKPTLKRPSIWLLKNSIIERYYIACWGRTFTNPVGELVFLGQQYYNKTIEKKLYGGAKTSKHPIDGKHPLASIGSVGNELINSYLLIGRGLLGETSGSPVYDEIKERNKWDVNSRGDIKIGS
ncbi:Endogenous retrovirus group 3 member 1 Env polyprotein [Plecturocebus cupreus]